MSNKLIDFLIKIFYKIPDFKITCCLLKIVNLRCFEPNELLSFIYPAMLKTDSEVTDIQQIEQKRLTKLKRHGSIFWYLIQKVENFNLYYKYDTKYDTNTIQIRYINYVLFLFFFS